MAVAGAAATGRGPDVTEVHWFATSPLSGRCDARETRSDTAVLAERFAALRGRGRGYLEVGRGEDYPVLALGFDGGVAVVHVLLDVATAALLTGDRSVAAESEVEVPVIDDRAVFTGAAAMLVDTAWSAVEEFVRGAEPGELGEWIEL